MSVMQYACKAELKRAYLNHKPLHAKLDMLEPQVKQKIPAVVVQLEDIDVFTSAGLLTLSAESWNRLLDENRALTVGIKDALAPRAHSCRCVLLKFHASCLFLNTTFWPGVAQVSLC